MRLPWPFGRSASSGGSSSGSGEGAAGGAAPADTHTPSGPASSAPATGAWRTLPPIQRTVGSAPLVANPRAFLDTVPGHQPLPPIVGQLGHEVSPAAPAGLVVARPSAVPSLTRQGDLPTRPVQRRASTAAEEPAIDWSSIGRAAEAAADPAPVRSVAPVAAAQAATPAVRPLTVAPPVAASRPVTAQRSATTAAAPSSAATTPVAATSSSPGPVGAASASGPAMPLGAHLKGATAARPAGRWAEATTTTSSPVGLGAPLATTPASSPTPAPAPVAQRLAATPAPAPSSHAVPSPAGPASAAPAGTTAPITSLSPVSARRAGLGAPMTSVPESGIRPSADPAQARTAMLLAKLPGGSPDVASPSAMPALSSGPAASGPDRSPAGTASTSRSLPVLPVAQRSASAPEATHAGHTHAPSSSTSTGGTTVSGQTGRGTAASAPPPAAAVRPTLGLRPLQPSVQAPEPSSPAGSPEASAPSPVPAQWPAAPGPAGASGPAAAAVPAAVPAQDVVPLQRLSSASTAPAFTAPAPAMPTEIHLPTPGGGTPGRTFIPEPPVSAGLGVPTAPSPAGPSAPWSPRRGTSAAPALALPRAAAATPVVQTARASSQAASSSQASGSAGAAAPTVQRSVTIDEMTANVQPAAPAGGGTAAPQTEADLDQLADALFGRIRRQLRSEVIHEREARGLTFDVF